MIGARGMSTPEMSKIQPAPGERDSVSEGQEASLSERPHFATVSARADKAELRPLILERLWA